MVSTNNSEHKTVTILALAALAATIFIVGSGRAFAPDRDVACVAPADPAGDGQASLGEPLPLDPEQRALVEYLSRRFFIASGATELMVGAAHRAAQAVGLDPLLVLAVISVESRFNPIAESVMGAKGLMQIIPKYHRAKLLEHGGDEAVFDPESNILVGTRILQEYIYRTGTQEAGLQSYNGAARDASAQYAQKVMAERDRLEQVVRTALSRHRAATVATASRGG
jgi:hypothetical protein